jgi:hypothetical protein
VRPALTVTKRTARINGVRFLGIVFICTVSRECDSPPMG